MTPAPQRVLVVSDDDVCVAPLVAVALRSGIGADAAIEVVSAGIGAEVGSPACSFAAPRASDPSAFSRYRSVPINGEVVRQADLVLVMTVEQRQQVNRLAPGSQRKVFTLREAAALALRPGTVPPSGEHTVAQLVEALHRRRGLVQPRPLPVPRRGILRRPVAVIEADDLLDGHLLDDETHRWALDQARAAAALLGGALRPVGGVERDAA